MAIAKGQGVIVAESRWGLCDMKHYHWHIRYKAVFGWTLDVVPYTSLAACIRGIHSVSWSKGENPFPFRVNASGTCGAV